MTDAPDTQTQVSETPPSFLRAYWEGAKDYTRMGRDFWRFLIVLGLFGSVPSMLNISSASIDLKYDAVDPKTIFSVTGAFAIVLLGSVSDWLGLRRLLLIFGGFLLTILGSGSVAWLAMGEAVPRVTWVVFIALLTVASTLATIALYRGLRRVSTPCNRGQGIILHSTATGVLGISGFALAALLVTLKDATIPFLDATTIVSIPDLFLPALCFALVGVVLAWKWITSERQAGSGKTGSDLRPSGPFSGLVDVVKASSTWRAAILGALCLLLTVPLSLGLWKLIPLHEYRSPVDGSRTLQNLVAHAAWIYLFVMLLLLPLVRIVSLPATITATAIGLSLAALLFSLPLGGIPLEAATLLGAVLVSAANMLLWFRFLEYALNGAPLGREGSLASVLGVVWLLQPLSRYVLPKLFESQHKAPWTQVLPDLVNPAASSVHSLWLIVLGIVLLATGLLFALRRYLFGEESGQGQPCE